MSPEERKATSGRLESFAALHHLPRPRAPPNRRTLNSFKYLLQFLTGHRHQAADSSPQLYRSISDPQLQAGQRGERRPSRYTFPRQEEDNPATPATPATPARTPITAAAPLDTLASPTQPQPATPLWTPVKFSLGMLAEESADFQSLNQRDKEVEQCVIFPEQLVW